MGPSEAKTAMSGLLKERRKLALTALKAFASAIDALPPNERKAYASDSITSILADATSRIFGDRLPLF